MSEQNSGNISRTNWAALAAMNDDEIDYSDIPPLTDRFFERASLRIPATEAQQLVQIEPDVLQWFQAQSGDYRALINTVLRQHIEQTPQ